MYQNQHAFHIPVMGIGHSIDTPIRVAYLGINSVTSIVDDLILEKIRRHYALEFGFPFEAIPRSAPDGRARRITAWLDLVHQIVTLKFNNLLSLPLSDSNEKGRFLQLLPEENRLSTLYRNWQKTDKLLEKEILESAINGKLRPGEIEVNIMSKVDAVHVLKNQVPEGSGVSDACAALRGFANSTLRSGVVLSAGFNPRLYSYISEFRDFYRDASGSLKKKIILKVSDFRSALIQGKFLAKMGLEVSEFRIESGLNCGGHAFVSDGNLLPSILREFHERRNELTRTFEPLIKAYYEAKGLIFPDINEAEREPVITVQGGIGTSGEARRLREMYGITSTGWGSPFLLVPEATCVDEPTMQLLAGAREEDLYLSNVSPLGVPFNNVRGSGSENYTRQRIEIGKPGSKCPKMFLITNTEFTENPICTASAEYQVQKIAQIKSLEIPETTKNAQIEQVTEKTCLCDHLGNGALIRLGVEEESYGKQSVCPGPNIAWFDRKYSLNEMIDHIYGRIPSLVPDSRPHMFAKEMTMYVDYMQRMHLLASDDTKELNWLRKMKENIEKGMAYCLEIAETEAYQDENLKSLAEITKREKNRLEEIFAEEPDLVAV